MVAILKLKNGNYQEIGIWCSPWSARETEKGVETPWVGAIGARLSGLGEGGRKGGKARWGKEWGARQSGRAGEGGEGRGAAERPAEGKEGGKVGKE